MIQHLADLSTYILGVVLPSVPGRALQVESYTRTLPGNTRAPSSVTPGSLSRWTSRSRGRPDVLRGDVGGPGARSGPRDGRSRTSCSRRSPCPGTACAPSRVARSRATFSAFQSVRPNSSASAGCASRSTNCRMPSDTRAPAARAHPRPCRGQEAPPACQHAAGGVKPHLRSPTIEPAPGGSHTEPGRPSCGCSASS
jgi:hypothetical protein